jgi:hypothetical protein
MPFRKAIYLIAAWHLMVAHSVPEDMVFLDDLIASTSLWSTTDWSFVGVDENLFMLPPDDGLILAHSPYCETESTLVYDTLQARDGPSCAAEQNDFDLPLDMISDPEWLLNNINLNQGVDVLADPLLLPTDSNSDGSAVILEKEKTSLCEEPYDKHLCCTDRCGWRPSTFFDEEWVIDVMGGCELSTFICT